MKQENLILQDPKKKKDKDIEGNKGGRACVMVAVVVEVKRVQMTNGAFLFL